MNDADRPRLSAGVKLRTDDAHGALLLVPEGLLKLNATAAAALALVDGERSVADVVDTLSARYAMPRESTARDVVDLLDRLFRRGYVSA